MSLLTRIGPLIGKIGATARFVRKLEARYERLAVSIGRIEIAQRRAAPEGPLESYESRVFSQFGEDGIIQRLIDVIPIAHRSFVEFGVEDYTEANTRFLLINNNWRGLVIDGSRSAVRRIRSDAIHWRHDLTALCSFITAENINDLLRGAGFAGDIGLLSVDVDGVDYWVWKAIDVALPQIVVCEYNGVYGPRARLTVPYDPAFQRSRAHYSNLYFGASLAALEALGREKGYRLVGSNSTGHNAFFVRADLAPMLPTVTAAEAYRAPAFRESRDPHGSLTFLDMAARRRLLADMPVVDLANSRTIALKDAEL